jgi:hypothetical protein
MQIEPRTIIAGGQSVEDNTPIRRAKRKLVAVN